MINKDELIKTNLHKVDKLEKEIIFPFFLSEFGELTSAYFIYQNFDQYAEIFTYLVNGKYVIEFDVSTIDYSIIINSIITVDEYKKSLQGKGRANKENREYLDKIMKEINANWSIWVVFFQSAI